MKKILGKRLPPEDEFFDYVLPLEDKYWECPSHKILYEPGDKVLRDGKYHPRCPLTDCKHMRMTYADKKWLNETYQLDPPF